MSMNRVLTSFAISILLFVRFVAMGFGTQLPMPIYPIPDELTAPNLTLPVGVGLMTSATAKVSISMIEKPGSRPISIFVPVAHSSDLGECGNVIS